MHEPTIETEWTHLDAPSKGGREAPVSDTTYTDLDNAMRPREVVMAALPGDPFDLTDSELEALAENSREEARKLAAHFGHCREDAHDRVDATWDYCHRRLQHCFKSQIGMTVDPVRETALPAADYALVAAMLLRESVDKPLFHKLVEGAVTMPLPVTRPDGKRDVHYDRAPSQSEISYWDRTKLKARYAELMALAAKAENCLQWRVQKRKASAELGTLSALETSLNINTDTENEGTDSDE